MAALLVAVGVPVAVFAALMAGVWRHRARHTRRHTARAVAFWPDIHDATAPVAHTEHRPPWDDAPEPDPAWVMDLRAALDEVQPSGWVKPELHHIMATLTPPGQPIILRVSDYPEELPADWDGGPWNPIPARLPEPSRLADTTDHAGIAMALDVADYMAAQDADATRYGGDLADWCAYQLRELRETLWA